MLTAGGPEFVVGGGGVAVELEVPGLVVLREGSFEVMEGTTTNVIVSKLESLNGRISNLDYSGKRWKAWSGHILV